MKLFRICFKPFWVIYVRWKIPYFFYWRLNYVLKKVIKITNSRFVSQLHQASHVLFREQLVMSNLNPLSFSASVWENLNSCDHDDDEFCLSQLTDITRVLAGMNGCNHDGNILFYEIMTFCQSQQGWVTRFWIQVSTVMKYRNQII